MEEQSHEEEAAERYPPTTSANDSIETKQKKQAQGATLLASPSHFCIYCITTAIISTFLLIPSLSCPPANSLTFLTDDTKPKYPKRRTSHSFPARTTFHSLLPTPNVIPPSYHPLPALTTDLCDARFI